MEVCRCGHAKEFHKRAGGFPVAQIRTTICSGHGELCPCREGFRPVDPDEEKREAFWKEFNEQVTGPLLEDEEIREFAADCVDFARLFVNGVFGEPRKESEYERILGLPAEPPDRPERRVADRRFAERGRELGELVEEKNAAYGDAGLVVAQCMKALYPNGIPTDKIDNALYTVRVLDKLCRIANRKDAFGENPWKDIGGYGILVSVNDERRSDGSDKRA